MATLKERILELITRSPGLPDREISGALEGPGRPQQPVNQACRDLERRGILARRPRPDGLIGNFISATPAAQSASPRTKPTEADPLSENSVKRAVGEWLKKQGWEATIRWDRDPGIDIEAHRSADRWIIEAKGRGTSPQEQGNYFLNGLGELLQRMTDPEARYSLAFPDLPRYRGLWNRLPVLAKDRLRLSMLFVDETGAVHEA